MVKENSFTFQEILLGSRKSYLEISDYLKELEELTVCLDREVESFKYRIYGKRDLYVLFYQNYHTLRGRIINLLEKLNLAIYGRDFGQVNKLDDANVICSDRYTAVIPEAYQQRFEEIKNRLLNHPFVRGIEYRLIYLEQCLNSDVLEISLGNIGFKDKILGLESLYIPEKDIVRFSGSEPFDNNYISELLASEVPKNKLSMYHQNLVSESASAKKPVDLIGADIYTNNMEFLVDELEDRVVLRRIKPKA